VTVNARRPESDQPEDRWAAVVVGEPVVEFEPEPPTSRAYRPDTVFDSWSTGHFTVRLASVRGYSHRYSGVPRQDAAEIAFDPGTGAVIFAVADGLSSASHSDVGAATACEAAVSVLRQQLSTGSGTVDFAEVVQVTADKLISQAALLPGQDQPGVAAAEELLATTLVAGYAVPDSDGAVASMIQVGDSSAWLLHGRDYQPVLKPKHDPHAQFISSAVSALPRIPGHLAPVSVSLPPDSVLLIGTDGFGDPLGDGDGKVGQLFAGYLGTPLPGRALAHLLDFSRETFDDDRTLVALWQQPHGAGEQQ
jgi:hypothetical protein